MSDKKAKILVIGAAIFLILIGVFLYKLFELQGYKEYKEKNKYINYEVNDYVIVNTSSFEELDDVYSNISVNKVVFKNIDDSLTREFLTKEEELLGYIKKYYDEIKKHDHTNTNSVTSNVKRMINDTVLSVVYELEFNIDENIFNYNMKKYTITFNIDLKTMKVLTNDDLLNKYNYTKNYIAEKIYNDEVLINDNEVVIDKNTNISLTKDDIYRKKEEYISRITMEFDNIIDMYIERKSLVIIYDTKEIKELFFMDEFESNIKIRYLK